MANRNFWKDKTVFLTGHTGFKGAWLGLWLHRLGARVTGYALEAPTDPSLFQLVRGADLIDSRLGDVRDAQRLAAAMAEVHPEIVIHMAAQPLVRDSYRIPVETYATNVMGTVHLLEAVRHCSSVRSVVVVTTDKCYENREWPWSYRENEPMGGYDPYSSSKGCAELVTASYRRSFFHGPDAPAVATARAGNVIGGGDWALDRLVPDIVRSLLAEKPVLIRNPYAIRPWQHVLEPLSGYLKLAQHLYEEGSSCAEAWNFGPSEDDARPVQWIVERLCTRWGNGSRYVVDGGDHPHEAHYLKLDSSKARVKLGWKPRWDLSTALDTIVDWTQSFQAAANVQAKCLEQIESYENTLRE